MNSGSRTAQQVYLTGLVLCLVCTCPIAATQAEDSAGRLLIVNARYLDVNAGNWKGPATIEIVDGRIAQISTDSLENADGARILDATGLFVVPGFIDTHGHVVQLRSDDPASPYKLNYHVEDATAAVLRQCLRYGITTIRDAAAPTVYGPAVRTALSQGKLTGPRLLTAGNAIQYSRTERIRPEELFVRINNEDSLLREIDRQAAAGVDWIKLYRTIPAELMTAAVARAHSQGLRVCAHLEATSWRQAAEAGLDNICHSLSWHEFDIPEEHRKAYRNLKGSPMKKRIPWLEYFEVESLQTRETIHALRMAGTSIDATLIAYATKFDPEYANPTGPRTHEHITRLWEQAARNEFFTPDEKARLKPVWKKVLHLIRNMHQEGVRITCGSDFPNLWVLPGLSLHQEMALLVEAGISEVDVLRIATLNGASLLGLEDETGQITTGKLADIIILGNDPARDINNTRDIRYVIKAGEVFRQNQPIVN